MNWYRSAKQVVALRKNVMRADLHVHCGDLADFDTENDMTSSVKSMLIAAITKGLDVIGIVAHDGPHVGIAAQGVAKNNGYDLFVLAGHEYYCTDKIRLIAYGIPEPIAPNLSSEQVIAWVHKNQGRVMALDLSRKHAQQMNALKDTPAAPDIVEIYNSTVGGYQDINCAYPRFVSTAAKSANALEQTNVFTLVSRKILEQMGFIPKGEGVDYEPQYLQRDDQIQQGADPIAVAEGDFDNQTPQNNAPQGGI